MGVGLRVLGFRSKDNTKNAGERDFRIIRLIVIVKLMLKTLLRKIFVINMMMISLLTVVLLLIPR